MSITFINSLQTNINTEVPSITENQAIGYKFSKSALVDLLFAAGSARQMSETDIDLLFLKAFTENDELSAKLLFYLRDARMGVGERRLFHIGLLSLAKHDIDFATQLIKYIPEFGSWKDVIVLIEKTQTYNVLSITERNIYKVIHETCCELVKNQLINDKELCEEKKNISLLAKWMPSINTSSPKSIALAHYLIRKLKIVENAKEYRQLLSKLRKHLKIVERQTSANQWSEIDYSAVPSLANLKYKNAFLKHDKTRREEFLQKVFNNTEKINASVLMPHEIVHKYTNGRTFIHDIKFDDSLEALWTSMKGKIKYDKNILIVRDGSGSMCEKINGKSGASAMDVSTGLAVYCAETNTGPWHNKFITFSATPRFITLPGKTLRDNLLECYKHIEVSNTNIEAVFNMVLKTVVAEKLTQEEIPDILIISDMEFDDAVGYNTQLDSLFKIIESQWKNNGYDLPKLIFWNVCSRTRTIPINENKQGVILMGGFSQNLLELALSGEIEPINQLISTLNVPRYEMIKKV